MSELSIQQKELITQLKKSHPELAELSDAQILSVLNSDLDSIKLTEEEKLSLLSFKEEMMQDGLKIEKTGNPKAKPKLSPEDEEELKKILKQRLNDVGVNLDKAQKSNGFLGNIWGGIKNFTGIGDSSEKVWKARKEDFKSLKEKSLEDSFKDITGVDYTEENLEKFLNGELQTKSEQALAGYTEGQEMAADTMADLVSGILSFGIYVAAVAAAPVTGGGSIALGVAAATAMGAGIKVGVKALDTLGSDRKYSKENLKRDLATGGFSGLLAPITGGVGSVAGKAVAKTCGLQVMKQVGKELVEEGATYGVKQGIKTALVNAAGFEYVGGKFVKRALAYGAEMATDGALGGAIDNAFRTYYDGGDKKEIWQATKQGFVGGAAMAPVIGGGMRGAGKVARNIFGKNPQAEVLAKTDVEPEVKTKTGQILPPSVKSSLASDDDLIAIHKMDLENFKDSYKIDDNFGVYKADLEEQGITTYALKSEDGKLIGYYQLEPIENGELYIYSIGVQKDLHGTKSSYSALKTMKEEITKLAEEKGVKKVVLDVDADNKALVKLYQKFGFKITNEASGVEAGQTYHDYRMEIELGESAHKSVEVDEVEPFKDSDVKSVEVKEVEPFEGPPKTLSEEELKLKTREINNYIEIIQKKIDELELDLQRRTTQRQAEFDYILHIVKSEPDPILKEAKCKLLLRILNSFADNDSLFNSSKNSSTFLEDIFSVTSLESIEAKQMWLDKVAGSVALHVQRAIKSNIGLLLSLQNDIKTTTNVLKLYDLYIQEPRLHHDSFAHHFLWLENVTDEVFEAQKILIDKFLSHSEFDNAEMNGKLGTLLTVDDENPVAFAKECCEIIDKVLTPDKNGILSSSKINAFPGIKRLLMLNPPEKRKLLMPIIDKILSDEIFINDRIFDILNNHSDNITADEVQNILKKMDFILDNENIYNNIELQKNIGRILFYEGTEYRFKLLSEIASDERISDLTSNVYNLISDISNEQEYKLVSECLKYKDFRHSVKMTQSLKDLLSIKHSIDAKPKSSGGLVSMSQAASKYSAGLEEVLDKVIDRAIQLVKEGNEFDFSRLCEIIRNKVKSENDVKLLSLILQNPNIKFTEDFQLTLYNAISSSTDLIPVVRSFNGNFDDLLHINSFKENYDKIFRCLLQHKDLITVFEKLKKVNFSDSKAYNEHIGKILSTVSSEHAISVILKALDNEHFWNNEASVKEFIKIIDYARNQACAEYAIKALDDEKIYDDAYMMGRLTSLCSVLSGKEQFEMADTILHSEDLCTNVIVKALGRATNKPSLNIFRKLIMNKSLRENSNVLSNLILIVGKSTILGEANAKTSIIDAYLNSPKLQQNEMLNKNIGSLLLGASEGITMKTCLDYLQVLSDAFVKKDQLKSATSDITDEIISKKFTDKLGNILNAINLIGATNFEAAFPTKLDGVIELAEKMTALKDKLLLDSDWYELLLSKINPESLSRYILLEKTIASLKKSFPEVKASGDPVKLKELQNEIATYTKEMQALRNSKVKLSPQKVLEKMRVLSAVAEHNLKDVEYFIKLIVDGTKESEAIWSEEVNKYVFKVLGIPFEKSLSNRLNLTSSKYLSEILSGSTEFKKGFKELLNLIKNNPGKSYQEIFDALPQNIKTRKMFEELKIDYDKWCRVDKDSFVEIQVKLSVDEARKASIEAIEKEFNNVAFTSLPKEETDKILVALKEIGVELKTIEETVWDANGIAIGSQEIKRLYKDNEPIKFEDLTKIMRTIKKVINDNPFWGTKSDDPVINNYREAMYNHLIKDREAQYKTAKEMKEDRVATIEIRKTDMNDISHSLFLGNHGACCTAVGSGCNQFSATTYIKNKMVTAIEVMDGENFVGNTMCYIAKVDGEPALILDNIELKADYHNNDAIRDAIVEYAKKLCAEIGRPDMPIYAGPHRHKLEMEVFEQSYRELQLVGDTGDDEIYLDFVTSGRYVDGTDVNKVKLYKIR